MAGSHPDARTSGRRRPQIDRLPALLDALQVVPLDGAMLGAAGPRAVREPHRHDYHELIWLRSGAGEHELDGERSALQPGTVTLIGRGQIHSLRRLEAAHGAVVRFGDELVAGDARGAPGWLVAARGTRSIRVPQSEAGRLDAVIDALGAEAARPRDACSPELERHLLAALLLLLERWYDAGRTEHRDADDDQVQLQRRFAAVLERDFARHHDAAHYAQALRVPQAALSQALVHVTGRATKDLVTERVLLEASRLLRFSDLSVQQVAREVGYRDPFHFSRAFKLRHGESPTAARARLRGKSIHP